MSEFHYCHAGDFVAASWWKGVVAKNRVSQLLSFLFHPVEWCRKLFFLLREDFNGQESWQNRTIAVFRLMSDEIQQRHIIHPSNEFLSAILPQMERLSTVHFPGGRD
jgi:hypothetical protein